MNVRDVRPGMSFEATFEGHWTDMEGANWVDYAVCRCEVTKVDSEWVHWRTIAEVKVVHNNPNTARRALVPEGGQTRHIYLMACMARNWER